MEKEPKFKVNDTVTYKNSSDCKNIDNESEYWYGGYNHAGFKGTVLEYLDYVNKMNCYKISVTTPEHNYSMLECEFEEYSNSTNIGKPLEIFSLLETF